MLIVYFKVECGLKKLHVFSRRPTDIKLHKTVFFIDYQLQTYNPKNISDSRKRLITVRKY